MNNVIYTEDKTNVLKAKNKEIKCPKVALIGNPNCGKTTLFNQLTGSCQYVGNWPGVTVEHKVGRVKNWSSDIDVVDLPGIYSLSPYSPEEIVTRNYVLNEHPDIIINIIDATNIERNLYLTTQLMELDCKIIIALNMTDLLEKMGKHIDYKKFEKEIGVPIIPISASKFVGIDELLRKVTEVYKSGYEFKRSKALYSMDVELAIKNIENILNNEIKDKSKIHSRFNAVKMFEDDPITMSEIKLEGSIKEKINKLKSGIRTTANMDREMIIADQRYKYICKICEKCVTMNAIGKRMTMTDAIDKILTGRFTAIPSFLIIIFSIFFVTFGPIGNFLKSGIDLFIRNGIGGMVENVLNILNASDWARSLVTDAIIGGVGSVISFLPQVLLLFTLLSILEDSGYMARAAFIMDKLLRRVGLSGRAFVPLLMGFGCSVPAVLGTRILENEKDKRLTIFLIPFMSCSAKMPVYFLFASAFFPNNQAVAIFSLYVLGILMGILSAYVFKDTLFKGNAAPFVMEMPSYKLPSMKNLGLHVWDRVRDFIERAGTVILGATIVIWFLQSFDLSLKYTTDSSSSILSSIGNVIAPVFKLCGFGDWRVAVSLFTGIIAKESIVSTMAVLYGAQNVAQLSDIMVANFLPYGAYAFMVFVLLYTPCVAAISAMKKELKSVKLTMISVFYQLFIAWLCSGLIYQIGMLVSKIL